MNKVYKVVWNRTKHCYVVVSELAKRAGKNKSNCLTVVGKAAAALGLGAVLLMGSAGSEVFAATSGRVIGGGGSDSGDTSQATGQYATISGGFVNHADGNYSSVSGGSKNHAKGENASISGGEDNEAWGDASSVSGGGQNKATGKDSSVTGGGQNQAGGEFATVSGGTGNKAFGYGSIVIGGTGNVTGKVAVDNDGNPLTDTNGNQYPADRDSNPFSRIGQDSVAIGGVLSSVQGNYSVGIAGGSTSAKAASGLAAGKQATVTVANGVAIGYQATASVIDSTRTADKEGRIVSFGHQKGDVYYDVDYQNHTVTEKKYTSDAYNRLVNVADGIDDHDVVVMEQLKNAKAEAVAEAKTNIKVKGDEYNVHADESMDAKGVQTTTISLLPKVTLQDTAKDPTGAKQVVLDGTAGTISAGLSTDQQNYISLNGTTGVAKVGAVEIGNQNFTYTYDKPDGMNDNGTVKLTSTRANANGTFVTGLSNRTWTPGNYVTGRAATEDQLEQAGRHFLSIKTAYVDEDGNAITLDGSNGNVTTGSSTLGGAGLTIANGPSVTTGGISGGSKQITEVKSGASSMDDSNNPIYGTDTNAANIGDVKNIAAKTVTVSGDGKNTTVAKTTNADDRTVDYKVSLNDSVTLGSDSDKKIALNGTAGTVSVGDKVMLNGANGTATIGGVTLGNDGTNTYLTGLTNKTWDPNNITSGRAATEDQLQTVSNTVNAGWKAKVGDQTLAVTPADNTLTFVAGDNIALTGIDSSNTITIATRSDVQFKTVAVKGKDGTYTNGINIGVQAGGGVNGSAADTIASITGLKNTKWTTDKYMSGRAATEDQLNEVAKIIKGEASASDIYVKNASVTYADNGTGTGTINTTKADITATITGLHDYYVTGGSVSADGKTLTLTKNGGTPIPGIDLTSVLNQDKDSHLVAADSGAYTVDSNGNVTLQVKNNVAGSTPTNVVISGIASNAALQQGLNFKANAAEAAGGSDTYNAQLGGTVSVLGGTAKNQHTYNTDNITTTMDNGTITVKLDNDLTANSLTAGSDATNGIVRVTGTKGAYVEMDGSDGSIHLGNNGGRYSALYQNYGGKGFLSSETSPRLEYAVDNAPNTRHTIATLDDGMKFAGDDAKNDSTKVVSRTLNSTLNITGGAAAANLTNSNIGVVKNDAGDGLTIKLNKDLTDMSTISFAPTAGTTGSGIKIGSQTIANNGTSPNSATGDYITGLTNTKWSKDGIVSGRAATEDQLQQVAKSIVNGSATGGGFGLSADKADNANAKEVKQDLGSSIKITTGGDTNLSTQADSANKAIVVSLNKELNLTKTTLTDETTGATTVVDGNGVVITPKQGSDADKVKLTTDGLSNGGKQITNVQSGLTGTTIKDATGDVLNHAATIGDLKTVSNGVKTDLTATGLNFKGNNVKGNNEDNTVHRNLGETLIIQGTGANGRDYDGGANVQVLANKDTGTLTVQLDRDLNAHTMTLGKAGAPGVDGETGILKINGQNKDGSISPVSVKATYADTTQDNTTTLKTAMSRITYDGGNGHSHTVATLEDGLQLSGDNGETANTTLNKKVTIKGGVAKDKLVDNTTDPKKNNNIGVIASQDTDGNTTLSLQLAKDITGLNTVTAGTVVMGNQTVISKGNVSSTGNYVTGLGNTIWDGKDYVSGRAATEDQLKTVSDSIQKSVGNAQFGITAGGLADGGDVTIKQNLGSAIRIYGDAPVTNEKNDGSGDFWDRSKANILTKVKKDHDGKDYVSVELQDHLEVGTHAGKDTGGKDIAGVDGSMQFKGASAKEVNITGDTGIALSDNGNQAAALRQNNGAGYLDLTGTTTGTKAAVSVHTGAKNLAKQDQTRLTYTDQDSKAHDVATLDDGLIFVGDTGTVSQALNSTLKISGGVSNASDLSDGKNVGVVASSDGLAIKLAKNLTGIDSITGLKNTTIGPDFATQGRAATEEQLKLMQSSITNSITQSAQGGGFALTSDEKGDDKIVKQDLGKAIQIKGDTTYKADGSVEKEGNIKTSIDNGAIKVGLNKDVDLGNDGSIKAGGVTIDSKGIDAGGKNITNVKSGIVNGNDSDNTNAANIGDVKTLAGEAAKTEIGKLGSRDFAGDDGETVSRGLGKSMKLSGGADTSKLTGGNIGVVKNAAGDGLDIKLSSELTGLTSVTTGNSTLNSDGLTVNNSEGKAGTTITVSGIKIAANGDNTHAVEVTNSNISMGGQQIHDVAPGTSDTDAVNVSQLKGLVSGVDGAVNKLNNRLNRVGAGAAALAALHPLDFNPEEKWNFAAGFGHYVNANAGAIGAFYQPNEDTLFSLGGSWGGGENMVNAGVSIRLGHGNSIIGSRTVMAREIMALKQQVEAQNLKLKENEDLKARLAKQDQEIAELKAMVLKLAAKG